MAKYGVGVQQMGSQISVRELGYTQLGYTVSVVTWHPILLGSWKIPALGTGETAGGDSLVFSKALALL